MFEDIFGKPNEGIHSYRFGGIAIVDFIMTVFAAWLLSLAGIPLSVGLFFLLLLSFILHAAFGSDTASNKFFRRMFMTMTGK